MCTMICPTTSLLLPTQVGRSCQFVCGRRPSYQAQRTRLLKSLRDYLLELSATDNDTMKSTVMQNGEVSI